MKQSRFGIRSTANLLGALILFVAIWGCSSGTSGSTTTTIPPQTDAPTFSPVAGTYTSAQNVTLADDTPGAAIYYTVDGTSPGISSSKYASPISVTTTETIQAVAVASGYTTSSIASAAYIIIPPTPTFSLSAGTYISAQNVTFSDANSGAKIYYTIDGSTPTTSSTPYSGPVTVSTTETLKAIAALGGQLSSVAIAAYVIVPPAPNISVSAGTYATAQNASLSDALSGANIYYTVDGSTPTTSSTPYSGPITISTTETLKAVAVSGGQLSSIVTAAYVILPPPTFSLSTGTYTAVQSVTLADTASGASIYYTVDGSTPTTSSTPYSGAVIISTTETIKAVAALSGQLSSVATATYVIVPPPPTFSLSAGTYASTQSVTLTDAISGANIYYTTDGSTPTASSTPYIGTVTVSTTETLKAVAALGGQLSSVATAAYVINLPPASLSAYAGSGQNIQAGSGFTSPLEVQALDASGNPVSGVAVTFSAPQSGPSATFSTSSCSTSAFGICSVTARANSSTGTFTVMASTAGLTTAFTLTNTGLHSYVVTVSTDSTTGVSSNCIDQAASSGSGNMNCSLRDALAAAAANATSTQSATITFAQTAATTIALVNGSLAIPSYTTIQGATSGAGTTLTNLITVDGANKNSVFTEASGITQATLNNLIITHGYNASVGGGIYTLGTLAVNNSTFIANQAALSGGAISNNGGNLAIFGSTLVNNTAQSSSGYGGGVDNFGGGTVMVSNSTLTGNQAAVGGGLYSSGTATISSSTLANNTATKSGGGLDNLGTMTVSSSIVNSNNPTDCAGLYCSPLWAYVVFSAVTPSPVDSSSITIAFSDSLGSTFSQTVAYGTFSVPAGVAGAFGSAFYYNTSGLDTTAITGEGIGNTLVITPENGATLSSFVITNPGTSFSAKQVQYPNLLSLGQNIYDQTAVQINLAPLANNGGPTQTMMPLTKSTALCLITPSSTTGTDQRGFPRSVTSAGTTCQDAGAVQTTY